MFSFALVHPFAIQAGSEPRTVQVRSRLAGHRMRQASPSVCACTQRSSHGRSRRSEILHWLHKLVFDVLNLAVDSSLAFRDGTTYVDQGLTQQRTTAGPYDPRDGMQGALNLVAGMP